MEIIIVIIQIIAGTVGSLVALMSIVLFLPFRWPAAAMWGLKVFASALSPLFILVGSLALIIGLAASSVFIAVIGIYITSIYLIHVVSVTRPPDSASGFEHAFGLNWKKRTKGPQKKILPSVS